MPGNQVKSWPKYHALRRKGMSKERAAKIANSDGKRRKSRRNALDEYKGGKR